MTSSVYEKLLRLPACPKTMPNEVAGMVVVELYDFIDSLRHMEDEVMREVAGSVRGVLGRKA